MTPDDWARKNREHPVTSGYPGPREPSLTPYIIAPVRAVHARTHKRVALVCCSQTGKSEGMLDIIGERFDTSPVPTIYLGPTKQFLQDQWEPRIMDLMLNTKSLRHKIETGKRAKVLKKMISGVQLRLAHGGSSVALKSDPFGLALTDEADELMANVKGAGDPIRLVDKRGDTYSDFVHYVTSTPTEGPSEVEIDSFSGLEFWAEIDPQKISSTIWRIWQSGTRHHWAWPCPHCHEYFIPRFKCLKWEKPKTADGREMKSDAILARKTAHLDCPKCGCEIKDESKAWMNERGHYIAPGQKIDSSGRITGEAPDSWTLSFWVSGLASPFQSWGDRAAEYVEAVRSGEQAEIQTIINGSFGEMYSPGSGEVPEWRELEALKSPNKPYVLGEVPDWVKYLTLAADVQKDRIIFSIRGWGHRATSCLVQLGELWGATSEEDVWEDFARGTLLDHYQGHPIRLALIDSGFRPGNPKQVPENRVYSFCQRHSRICRPTKGRDTLLGKPVRPSKIEARVNWRGKLETVGIELFLVDTDYFKRIVHERLRWPVDEPGAFILPDDTPDYYLQQLVSEARIQKPGGRPVWVQRSKENHFFDIEAMHAAAGWFLGAQRLNTSDVNERRIDAGTPTISPSVNRMNKMAAYAAALNR